MALSAVAHDSHLLCALAYSTFDILELLFLVLAALVLRRFATLLVFGRGIVIPRGLSCLGVADHGLLHLGIQTSFRIFALAVLDGLCATMSLCLLLVLRALYDYDIPLFPYLSI